MKFDINISESSVGSRILLSSSIETLLLSIKNPVLTSNLKKSVFSFLIVCHKAVASVSSNFDLPREMENNCTGLHNITLTKYESHKSSTPFLYGLGHLKKISFRK